MPRLPLIATFLVPSILAAQPPSLAHATAQFEQRNYDAARVELQALARANPADARPVLYLGRIALSQNDVDESVRQFERCVAIDDTNANCHVWLGNALGTAAQRANKFRQIVLARRVKSEFERGVELDPRNVDARSGLLQYYLYAPGIAGGSVDKAREQAAEIEKVSALRGALASGMIAGHLKDATGAVAAYRRAIAVAPDSSIGYNALANYYVRDKRWSDAFAVIDGALARMPKEPSALLGLARVAALSGEQLERGESAVKSWLAAPPREAGAIRTASVHVLLASIYDKMGRSEQARDEYARALSLDPKNEAAQKGSAAGR